MFLFVLLLVSVLVSFVVVLMGTEEILKRYCPYRNASHIWAAVIFIIGVIVILTVFFDFLPPQVCVIVPSIALIAAIGILYYYSGLKNRCAILCSIALLFASYFWNENDYTLWMIVGGSLGLMSCSLVRLFKR